MLIRRQVNDKSSGCVTAFMKDYFFLLEADELSGNYDPKTLITSSLDVLEKSNFCKFLKICPCSVCYGLHFHGLYTQHWLPPKSAQEFCLLL